MSDGKSAARDNKAGAKARDAASQTRPGGLSEQEALRLLVDNLPSGAALFTMDGRRVVSNPEFRRIHGIDSLPPGILPDGVDPASVTLWDFVEAGVFDRYMENPRAMFTELFARLKRGEEFVHIMESRGRVVEVRDTPIGKDLFLTTQTDVTERVIAEREVEHMANHDALTDLNNRAAWGQALKNALEGAKARSEQFGIISVDLDRFKDVNDTFGHGAGDALLREVARRLRKAAPDSFIARLGGDEFMILSQGPQPETAARVADRLFMITTGEVEIEGHSLRIGLSAGIALYPKNGAGEEDLLNAADAALYRSKEQGRGTWCLFEPEMDQRIHNRRKLARDLREALKNEQFSLHYQPQSTVAGEVTGFEVLLRWEHPKHGLMAPEQFIRLAEEIGLIVDIGEWVLETACREAANWDPKYSVAVNLSPLQVRHGELPQMVHRILFETGLKPNRLELEITEGALVHDFPRALSVLRRIKALGVHVTMDDFGTGYSSLSYLQAFPFDKVKIDRSFVGDIGRDRHAREIVKAVIGLGRGLDVPIVAEGVETEAQRRFLEDENCYGIQGFLLGRPESHPNTAARLDTDEDAGPARPADRKSG